MAPIDTAILLLGAQRSGTTWLGKIFDSHPDVLYRHEPDHAHPPRRDMDETLLRATLAAWIEARDQRTAAKRPFFRKSWQSPAGFCLRHAWATILAAAGQLPALGEHAGRLPVPDFGEAPRVVLKSIDWCDGIGACARLLPGSRTIVILRHPCGQVASVMRGNRQGRFSLREAGTDMPFDEVPTLRFAAERGVDDAAFQALPDAAKYAWDWVRFNETALAALAGRPNAHVVVYEALCTQPIETARALLAFADLDWHAQTEAFLARSTSDAGETGYYAVFRDSIAAADRWRASMPGEDQAAVLDVVRQSWLRRYWDDIGGDTDSRNH